MQTNTYKYRYIINTLDGDSYATNSEKIARKYVVADMDVFDVTTGENLNTDGAELVELKDEKAD